MYLWWWAKDYAPDGNLYGFSDLEIARASRWRDNASAYVDALALAGFLTEERRLNDWDEYVGAEIKRRRRDSERKRVGIPTEFHGSSTEFHGSSTEARRNSSVEERRVEEITPPYNPPPHDVGPTATLAADEDFERFYAVFPTARKGSRREVRRAWDKAVLRAQPEVIIAAAERYRDDPNRQDAYTAGAARWLNRDGWEEGPLPPRGSAPSSIYQRLGVSPDN